MNVGYEKMIRAVALSDLVTIHLKSGIGRLSAYCGAVSAGCGCGAGIAYLYGGGLKEIEHTIVNSIAIDSGMVCDGAKASVRGENCICCGCRHFGLPHVQKRAAVPRR